MKASLLYRIASVLLFLFALGHTVGFRQHDPQWGVESVLGLMQSVHFNVQGFNRTYWDVFVGAGFFVSVFLVFSAVFAWQLGSLPAETLGLMRGPRWAFALCFIAVTFLTVRYFFLAPIVFTAAITLCLIAAAWLSPKRTT